MMRHEIEAERRQKMMQQSGNPRRSRLALLSTLAGVAAFAAPLAIGLSARLHAQAPQAAAAPTFEVASVKPNKSGEPFIRLGIQPGGRFTAQNMPLRELIRFAYGVQPFQIEGGPGWINSDRFDITAKAEGEFGPGGPGQVGPVNFMMRALLAERFTLVVRSQKKEMPIYELVMARADRKLGAKLEVSTLNCAAQFAARRGGGPPAGPPPGPPGPPQTGERRCGLFMGPGTIMSGESTMANLAQALGPRVSRIIVDKTGLDGLYTFEVVFTPDQVPPAGAALNGAPFPQIDPNGPSLFTALQEQLGLKLENSRAPVEMLVIQSVEQPSPD
jgi:uncharacterized protein (TIGR03435 family)